MTQKKTPPGELEHYGVKGMKWGHRKKSLPMHHRYSRNKQMIDRKTFGSGGVRRINKRMHEGKTYKQALRREMVAQTAKSVAATGAISVGVFVAQNRGLTTQIISKMAETNRGRAHNAATMGLPRKPTNGPTFAKKNRSGAYKISSL